MIGLPTHGGFPGDAEPGQVLIDRALEFRFAAGRVDILDAQQETPAGLTGEVEIAQRRISVAEVQIAIWAGRKTENGWH
jgi:hypothetical protein